MYNHFQHELAWYDYWYVGEQCKVVVCHKTLEPCTMQFYSREHLQELVLRHKWNPFLLPIYKEALRHFPEEIFHENKVRQENYI